MTRVSQTKESCQKKNPPPRIDKVAVDRIVRAQLRQNSSSRPCEFILASKMFDDKQVN